MTALNPRGLGLPPPGKPPRDIAVAILQLQQGKTNNTGSVTLTANAATTTISDIRVGINSVILLSPLTANAAASLPTIYFNTPGKQSVVINHANNAYTDKTYSYVVIG